MAGIFLPKPLFAFVHGYYSGICQIGRSLWSCRMRIDKPAEVRPALEAAFAMKDRTVFLDVMTDSTENVYPMIEAGKGHHDMKLRVAIGTSTDGNWHNETSFLF